MHRRGTLWPVGINPQPVSESGGVTLSTHHRGRWITEAIGHPESTCPKSWRHTFATLLQDINVDPLIRRQVMGHKLTLNGGLGMTANDTHTRPVTRKEQIERALRRWPESLRFAVELGRE